MSARGDRVKRFWRDYAGSIAFIAVIVVGSIGFARVENARFEGCEGGNLLREGLRATEAANIAQSETLSASEFPGIPPTRFHRLQSENRERAQYNIEVRYADKDCGTKIDLPLTGATITLPP